MGSKRKWMLVTSAAALLGSGYAATPVLAESKLVKCMIRTGSSCGSRCPQKVETMTREECRAAGGEIVEDEQE